jgi:hypothetical protein
VVFKDLSFLQKIAVAEVSALLEPLKVIIAAFIMLNLLND